MVHEQPNENLVRALAPESIYLRTIKDRFDREYNSPGSTVISVCETKLSPTAQVRYPFILVVVRTSFIDQP